MKGCDWVTFGANRYPVTSPANFIRLEDAADAANPGTVEPGSNHISENSVRIAATAIVKVKSVKRALNVVRELCHLKM